MLRPRRVDHRVHQRRGAPRPRLVASRLPVATVHGNEDEPIAAPLLRRLTAIAGRVVWNDWPTGLAVTTAQHHGGPHPATTSPLHTSVGTAAVTRFLRPVAFQSVPAVSPPGTAAVTKPTHGSHILEGTVWSPATHGAWRATNTSEDSNEKGVALKRDQRALGHTRPHHDG